MRLIQPNETNEPVFPIYNIHDIELALESEQFSEMIPVILDFLDPQEELKSAQKKSKKKKKRTVAQKASFKIRNVRADFYNNLTDDQMDAVLDYLYTNHYEDRLINLFNAIEENMQIKIINDMLNVAFKADLASYTKEVTAIRRKISKGYVKPANHMKEAQQCALSGDYIKAILYLSENPHKIGSFFKSFESNPDIINNLIREVMKWMPKGEYLAA